MELFRVVRTDLILYTQARKQAPYAPSPLHPHIPRIQGRNTNVSLSITSSQVTVLVFPNFRGERSTAYWAYHHVLRNLQKVTADRVSTDEGTDPTEDPVSVTCHVGFQHRCLAPPRPAASTIPCRIPITSGVPLDSKPAICPPIS
ncbi:hypothetical protein F5888DRAFT_1886513 [Russula emetica]|nr:hypothetical protein F5888DRAFT_1886513 [Russula emetica]